MLAAAIVIPPVINVSGNILGSENSGQEEQIGLDQSVADASEKTGRSAAGTLVKADQTVAEASEKTGRSAAGALAKVYQTVAEASEKTGRSAAEASEKEEQPAAEAPAAAEPAEGAGAAAAEAVKQGTVGTAADEAERGSAAEKDSGAAAENADAAGSGKQPAELGSDEKTSAEKSAESESDEKTSGEKTAESGSEGKTSGEKSAESEPDGKTLPGEPTVRKDGGVSMDIFAMDTYVTLLAYGDKAEKAVRAAAKEIRELDALLSTGVDTSEISRINAAGSVKPSEDVEVLVSKSLEIWEETDGLFNIAIYPVMKKWGFPEHEYRVPTKSEIKKALKLADASAIKLVTAEDVKEAQEEASEAAEKAAKEAAAKAKKEAEAAKKAEEADKKKKAADDEEKDSSDKADDAGDAEGTLTEEEAAAKAAAEIMKGVPTEPSLTLEQKGMGIDLGGIAKGYTADRVEKIFKKYDVKSGIISLGGNVQVLGTKENGRAWKVAIQNPENSLEYLGVLDVEDKAVVTSGGYERYFEENGKRYHDIIDPRTGYPADSGLLSATVICDEGIMADGLSTALFIMGKDEAEKFWRKSDWKFDYVLEDKEGTLYITRGIANSLVTDANVVVVEY